MAAGFSEAPGPQLRVGHAERENVAAQLREHYASGRLALEELHERLDAALAAKTRADLDALLTDLPPGSPSAGTRPVTSAGTRPGGTGPEGGRSSWRGAGPAVAAMAWSALMLCALLAVGFLGVFGAGVGRPFGIVLVLAGLAFMRRILFGRRRHRHHCGRGPRPRRRW